MSTTGVFAMLTRPLTLNESDDKGRGLVAVTLPPALPLADDDGDETQTDVFSPPAPPWSSSSSSPASSPPLPCASSSSSALSLTPPPFPSSSPLMPLLSTLPPPPSSLSSLPSVAPCTLPPPVCFTPCTSPTPSPFSPHPSSSPRVPPLLLSHLTQPPPVSSPPPFAPSVLPPSLPPPSSFSIIPVPPSVSPPSSSCPSFHPSPPSLLSPPLVSSSSLHPPPPHNSPFSSAPLPPVLYHSSSHVSLLPPTSVFFTPHTSAICSALSTSSPPAPSSLLSPPPPATSPHVSLPSPHPVAPFLLPSAPHSSSCPCSSLLPRLLSAHRLEVRRLLRGALASLGRRLDSLERRSRKRKKRSRQKGGGAATCSLGAAAIPFSPASSCSLAHIPPVTSSSESEDSPTPPLFSSLSQSEQSWRSVGEEEGEGRKRRRKNQEEEEEDAGRFVGRMAFSFRGGAAEEEAPLTLHNFNKMKQRRIEGGGTSQSEKAVCVVRQNGYRAPLLHSISSSSSHHALHLLQSAQSGRTCSQSETLSVSSGQWRFSDLTPPLALSSNHNALHLWLCSFSSYSPAPMLRLSAVAMEMMLESVRGGACGSPLWPLKDWTAPPSLSIDHCYVRRPTSSPTISAQRQQKQWANHSSRSLVLPRRRPLTLPPCSSNGLSAPFPIGQSAAGSEFLSTNGERGKRVSQIRIRRASPRETPLTPMGLPKVKRLKKKEFSLEEIYTNKNYKSPTANRSLETIFEEPREKDGALFLIGQQRRRRLLLFPDFTQPRKRKRPQGAGLPVAMVPRKRAAARRHCHGNSPDDSDLDVMLVERLSALEDFMTRQGLDM